MVRDRYQNLPEEEKVELHEYMKKYYLTQKVTIKQFKDPRVTKFVS